MPIMNSNSTEFKLNSITKTFANSYHFLFSFYSFLTMLRVVWRLPSYKSLWNLKMKTPRHTQTHTPLRQREMANIYIVQDTTYYNFPCLFDWKNLIKFSSKRIFSRFVFKIFLFLFIFIFYWWMYYLLIPLYRTLALYEYPRPCSYHHHHKGSRSRASFHF